MSKVAILPHSGGKGNSDSRFVFVSGVLVARTVFGALPEPVLTSPDAPASIGLSAHQEPAMAKQVIVFSQDG